MSEDIMKKRKIYVASSWRNAFQPETVLNLREAGHEVYDFRGTNAGFHWSEIDENWEQWTNAEYGKALNSLEANKGYQTDFNAMVWADTFVGVMPFGRSASMEMGWAAGRFPWVLTILYFPCTEPTEPELMMKMFDRICFDYDSLLEGLQSDFQLRYAGDGKQAFGK